MFEKHFILLGFLFLFLLSTISPELQLQQNTTGNTLYYYLGIYMSLINVKEKVFKSYVASNFFLNVLSALMFTSRYCNHKTVDST